MGNAVNTVYIANCAMGYAAFKVILLWNRFANCREGYAHTWSKVRDDGLAATYLNNDPERGEATTEPNEGDGGCKPSRVHS